MPNLNSQNRSVTCTKDRARFTLPPNELRMTESKEAHLVKLTSKGVSIADKKLKEFNFTYKQEKKEKNKDKFHKPCHWWKQKQVLIYT